MAAEPVTLSGADVRGERMKHRFSQRDLSAATGLQYTTICNIERNTVVCTQEYYESLLQTIAAMVEARATAERSGSSTQSSVGSPPGSHPS